MNYNSILPTEQINFVTTTLFMLILLSIVIGDTCFRFNKLVIDDSKNIIVASSDDALCTLQAASFDQSTLKIENESELVAIGSTFADSRSLIEFDSPEKNNDNQSAAELTEKKNNCCHLCEKFLNLNNGTSACSYCASDPGNQLNVIKMIICGKLCREHSDGNVSTAIYSYFVDDSRKQAFINNDNNYEKLCKTASKKYNNAANYLYCASCESIKIDGIKVNRNSGPAAEYSKEYGCTAMSMREAGNYNSKPFIIVIDQHDKVEKGLSKENFCTWINIYHTNDINVKIDATAANQCYKVLEDFSNKCHISLTTINCVDDNNLKSPISETDKCNQQLEELLMNNNTTGIDIHCAYELKRFETTTNQFDQSLNGLSNKSHIACVSADWGDDTNLTTLIAKLDQYEQPLHGLSNLLNDTTINTDDKFDLNSGILFRTRKDNMNFVLGLAKEGDPKLKKIETVNLVHNISIKQGDLCINENVIYCVWRGFQKNSYAVSLLKGKLGKTNFIFNQQNHDEFDFLLTNVNNKDKNIAGNSKNNFRDLFTNPQIQRSAFNEKRRAYLMISQKSLNSSSMMLMAFCVPLDLPKYSLKTCTSCRNSQYYLHKIRMGICLQIFENCSNNTVVSKSICLLSICEESFISNPYCSFIIFVGKPSIKIDGEFLGCTHNTDCVSESGVYEKSDMCSYIMFFSNTFYCGNGSGCMKCAAGINFNGNFVPNCDSTNNTCCARSINNRDFLCIELLQNNFGSSHNLSFSDSCFNDDCTASFCSSQARIECFNDGDCSRTGSTYNVRGAESCRCIKYINNINWVTHDTLLRAIYSAARMIDVGYSYYKVFDNIFNSLSSTFIIRECYPNDSSQINTTQNSLSYSYTGYSKNRNFFHVISPNNVDSVKDYGCAECANNTYSNGYDSKNTCVRCIKDGDYSHTTALNNCCDWDYVRCTSNCSTSFQKLLCSYYVCAGFDISSYAASSGYDETYMKYASNKYFTSNIYKKYPSHIYRELLSDLNYMHILANNTISMLRECVSLNPLTIILVLDSSAIHRKIRKIKTFAEKIKGLGELNIQILTSIMFYYSWEYVVHYCQSDFDCVNAQISIYNRRMNLFKCYGTTCGHCNADSDCNGIVGGLNTCNIFFKYCHGSGITIENCNTVSYDYGVSDLNTYCYICYNSNGISKCPSNSCASTNFYVCAKKCFTDSDCPYNMPKCDITTNQCQPCRLFLSYCSIYGMNSCIVSTSTHGYCSQSCNSDLDCAQIGFKPYCGAVTPNSCFECPNDEWCHINKTMKICHFTRGICLNSCTSNGDCLNPARSKCSIDGFCVGCSADSDCSQVLSYKRCINMVCKQCTTDSQCPSFDPVALYCVSNFCKSATGCNPKDCTLQTASKCSSGSCVACTIDSECSHILGPRIYCVSGTCVECTVNNDCTSPFRSLCLNNVCSKCTANGDCSHMTNGRNITCNVVSGECVCTTNGGCNNPSLSKCSSGVCSACATNGDCAHMQNDMINCNSGICKKSCNNKGNCKSPQNSLCLVGYCSSCSTNADCSHMKGYMVICVNGECKQCGVNSDCMSPFTSACRNNQCTFCASDGDCTHINGMPCIHAICQDGCTTDGDCVNPLRSKCLLNACIPCMEDSECRTRFQMGKCGKGGCIGCISNTQCLAVTASKCAKYDCIGCIINDDCKHIIGYPNCSSGTCICLTNGDCFFHQTNNFCSLGTCVECLTNSDCSLHPTNNFCSRATCVICLKNVDCNLVTASKCKLNVCSACEYDEDCLHIAGGALTLGLHYCNYNACEECATNSNCDSDDKSLCDGGVCADCNNDNDCSARPANKFCVSGDCVPCIVDSACMTPGASKCSGNTCIGCLTDAECSHISGGTLKSGLRFCVSLECKECTNNNHCNSNDKSLCSGGTCTDCAADADCSARGNYKFCSFDGNCVLCLVNANCIRENASKCNIALNMCIGCVTNDDCSHIPRGLIYCKFGNCVNCLSNNNCITVNLSKCDSNLQKCVGCQSDGDCAHIIDKSRCLLTQSYCVECITNEQCSNDLSKICYIGNKCELASSAINDLLVDKLDITEISQISQILPNNSNIQGINEFSQLLELQVTTSMTEIYQNFRKNADQLQPLFDQYNTTNITELGGMLADTIMNEKEGKNFLNTLQQLQQMHNQTSLLQLISVLLNSGLNKIPQLDTNAYESAFKNALLALENETSNMNEYFYIDTLKSLNSEISNMINQKNKTYYTIEETIELSAAIRNSTDITIKLVAKNSTILNASAILLASSQNIMAIELLSKKFCGSSIFPLSAVENLFKATDNIFKLLSALNDISSAVTQAIITNLVVEEIENKLIDHLNSTYSNIKFNGNVFNISVSLFELSGWSNDNCISFVGDIVVSLNCNKMPSGEANETVKSDDDNIVMSIKEWSTIILPMAGVNASFDKKIKNATILSLPVSVTVKDARSKLKLVNLDTTFGLLNITLPIAAITNNNKIIGGLFYDTNVWEWNLDGILSTMLASDNKTATITTSHLTDFQLFSYVENQLVDLKNKSNLDMIQEPSALNPKSTDLYQSNAFCVMCGAAIVFAIAFFLLMIIQMIKKATLLNRVPNHSNIKILLINWIKSFLFTHMFIAPIAMYDPLIGKASRMGIYSCRVFTIFTMGALFHQSDSETVEDNYTSFQKVMIVLTNLVLNTCQSLVLTYLMKRQVTREDVVETEQDVNKQNRKQKIKELVGGALIFLINAGYFYIAAVILAHFNENVRSKWMNNFMITFLTDNLISHLIKTILFGGLTVLILKEKIKGKAKDFIIKVLDKNVLRCFNLDV